MDLQQGIGIGIRVFVEHYAMLSYSYFQNNNVNQFCLKKNLYVTFA